MGKPWSKTEIDFINHPKFRALNSNAICLWIEGKNYCDKHVTDGLIPSHEVKRFRFAGKKSIESLLASAGQKNDAGEMYKPLWSEHPVGFKMVGYLEYNPCREEVMARVEDANDAAELKKIANAKRQAEYRAKRKAEIAALKNDVEQALRPRHVTHNVTPTCSTPTETVTVTVTETTPLPKNGNGDARPRALAPIHDNSHKKHAVCGRVCLHASQFGSFVRRRNTPNADAEVRAWAEAVVKDWTMGDHQTHEPGDEFDFWRDRYDEKWPAFAAKAPDTGPVYVRASEHPSMRRSAQ